MHCFMCSGRLFQRLGPACERDLSPHDLLTRGTMSEFELEERKDRAGL